MTKLFLIASISLLATLSGCVMAPVGGPPPPPPGYGYAPAPYAYGYPYAYAPPAYIVGGYYYGGGSRRWR